MKFVLTILICFFFLNIKVFSQDIIGGELFVSHIFGDTYQFNVYLYTKVSAGIDRTSIHIDVGNGSYGTFNRVSQMSLTSDIDLNQYTGFYTYPGDGIYTISVLDSFRIDNINNVPNSGNVPFRIEYTLIRNQTIGFNSSTYFLNFQNQTLNNSGIISHNAVANDHDGDSLSYEVVGCNTNGYSFPTGSLYIDSITGNFTWDQPTLLGNYEVCLKAKEWRNGLVISANIRDMVISVTSLTEILEISIVSNQLYLFPNPTRGIFNIKINDSTDKIVSLVIFDILGNQVFTSQRSDLLQIDLTKESSGMYFINVLTQKKKVFNEKLIIQ